MNKKKSLEILHFTDIHGAYYLFNSFQKIASKADLIVLSGDITHFGKAEEARKIIDSLNQFNTNILAVAGNCDYPVVDTYLDETGTGIHLKIIEFGGYFFTGISGSLPCPGKTPFEYTESEVAHWLQHLSTCINDDKPLILVSHQPPINTINDQVNPLDHVGSAVIREFIQNKKPLLCLTGHIHEGIGIDSIGNCKVINPGPFRYGNYARIVLTDQDVTEMEILLIQP
jgi:Icc-related predicted phosphoesterase